MQKMLVTYYLSTIRITGCLWLALHITCCSVDYQTPLMELLPSDKTGIDFANTVVENDSFNIMNFIYLYNGAGLAAGDINNDGWTDLFFSGNQVASKLYLNETEFQFKDISLEAGITDSSWCTGVSMVDINQDGWMDIYVSVAHPDPQQPAPNLLYINQGVDQQGVPHFVESAHLYGLADSGYSTHAAFFDYDGDGDLDMYLLTNGLGEVNSRSVPRVSGPLNDGTASNTDRLYRNEGPQGESDQITFVNVSKEAGILTEGWGLGIAISDINQDGWPDIYVANDFLSSDILYINKGAQDGLGPVTFVNEIDKYLKHQSHFGMGVDIADFNNDGLPDIVELDMMPEDNARKKSMFATIPHDQWYLTRKLGYQAQYIRNSLQLNNGNGRFSEIGQLAGVFETDWSWAPLLFDVDNDGFRDLLITNGYHRDVTDLDYINYREQASMFGTEVEKERKIYEALGKLVGVKKHNYLFRNKHDLTFEDKSGDWGFIQPSYSNGTVFADFDNDGDLDIATNNINDPAFLYRNHLQEHASLSEDKPHFLRIKLDGIKPNRNGIGAKIEIHYQDQNGVKQRQYHEHNLYRGYKSTVEPVIHFGLGMVDKIDSLHIIWPDGAEQIRLNIAADQELTLDQHNAKTPRDRTIEKIDQLFVETTMSNALSYQHREKDHIDFNITPLKLHKHSQNGPGMAVGDVDGNGLDDLFIGGSRDYPGTWFMQQSPGRFMQDTMQIDRAYEDMGSLLFDADQDGDLDLYVVSGGSEVVGTDSLYQDRLYRNDGQGHFQRDPTALPEMFSSGSCVTACDYDQDGDLDLFVGGRILVGQYPMPPRSYLLENENGRFSDVTETVAPGLNEVGMVTAALWTDVDRDGWRDLLIVGEWMPIFLFKNQYNKSQNPQTPAFSSSILPSPQSSSGWWNSLAAGDFDKDGDMDYVVGNLGLNSRFRASEDHPVCIYAKDFDENGSFDPVLCYFIQDGNYPYHPRDVLVKQIAGMRKRFPLYADYGAATLDDLLTSKELEGAYVVKSTRFASSYIENAGNGEFNIRELPVEAQFAPLFGLQVMDFDGDGNLDILMTGNSYSPDIHIGNYDAMGGLLLSGDGKGRFNPVPAKQSGIWVDGDGKSLARIATGASGYLLAAACNQGPLKVYAPRQVGEDRFIELSPRDSYLEIADGAGNRWIEELYWGSGYLSQSSRQYVVSPEIQGLTIVDDQGKRRDYK